MPCYHPITAWRANHDNKNGKRVLVFKQADAAPLSELQIPCGQCHGCKLERSRQWAIRCIHEASLQENNCFITLTYDMDNIPVDCGLNKRDYQVFMKRLRKKYPNKKIRFFHCGEYGDKNLRPHYHAIIFNHDFQDRLPYSEKEGITLDTSEELTKLWQKGLATVGNVTFESAAYVARYCLKKINGKQAEELGHKITRNYERLDPETGEIYSVIPEYTTMSLKPGIGHGWYTKFNSDVYPSDEIIINGQKVQPPKYYDSLYEHIDTIKTKRIRRAFEQRENNTPERLVVREIVKLAQTKQLQRNLED